MKVRALTSFVGHYGDDRKTIVAHAGMEFELPPGTDWIGCGFVEPLESEKAATVKEKPRVAVRNKGETATRK